MSTNGVVPGNKFIQTQKIRRMRKNLYKFASQESSGPGKIPKYFIPIQLPSPNNFLIAILINNNSFKLPPLIWDYVVLKRRNNNNNNNSFKSVWVLKMRALTLQLYVDDIESEEEGIAESLLDNYMIASMPRPGTSLKNPGTAMVGQGFRPKTQSGIFSLSKQFNSVGKYPYPFKKQKTHCQEIIITN